MRKTAPPPRQSEHFVPALQQTVCKCAAVHCVVPDSTLSKGCGSGPDLIWGVELFCREEISLSRQVLTRDTDWRKSARPSTSVRTWWPVLHVGIFPPSGGCTHWPVRDADPVFCPSIGVNIRRLRHEGLGKIPGHYTWDLWGTEWHKNRLFSEYLRYPLSVLWFRRTVTITRSIMPDNFIVQLAARGSLSAREMPPTRERNKIIRVICYLFYYTNCCVSQAKVWLLYWNLTVQNYFLIICGILRNTFFGLSKIVIFLDSRALCVSFSVFVSFWNKLCCF